MNFSDASELEIAEADSSIVVYISRAVVECRHWYRDIRKAGVIVKDQWVRGQGAWPTAELWTTLAEIEAA